MLFFTEAPVETSYRFAGIFADQRSGAGLRRAEAAALELGEYDPDTGHIKVVEVLDMDLRRGRLHPTKILQALNLPAESGL